MYAGMSALVCSLIWTYLHSANKRLSGCDVHGNSRAAGGGREQTINQPSLSRKSAALITFFFFPCSLPPSEASPWWSRVTHLEFIFNRVEGGTWVRSHAGTPTSVWRRRCKETCRLTHTQNWAKSVSWGWPCEGTARYWRWVRAERRRQWQVSWNRTDNFYLLSLLSVETFQSIYLKCGWISAYADEWNEARVQAWSAVNHSTAVPNSSHFRYMTWVISNFLFQTLSGNRFQSGVSCFCCTLCLASSLPGVISAKIKPLHSFSINDLLNPLSSIRDPHCCNYYCMEL